MEILHLLHLYNWTLSPTSRPLLCKPKPSARPGMINKCLSRFDRSKRSQYSLPTIPCASELLKARVKFQRRADSDSLLNIDFSGNVFEIPQLSIVDGTNSMFCNLVVFEQCYPDTKEPIPLKLFTSFALFWSCIVQAPEDVAILRQQGIIENKLGSNEEIVRLLSRLCKEVIINYGGHHFAKLFEAVNSYYGSKLKIKMVKKKN